MSIRAKLILIIVSILVVFDSAAGLIFYWQNNLAAPAQTLNLIVFWTLLIVLIIVTAVFYLFIGIVTKKISRLSVIARQIAGGRFDIKLEKGDIKAKDETAVLARTLKETSDRLSGLYKDMERKVQQKTKELSSSLKETKKNNDLLEENKKAMLNILEDVEAEKEAADKEREKINTIIHSIGDAVFVTDNNYKIILFNQVAADLSGHGMKEAIGKRYNQVMNFVKEENGNPDRKNDEFIVKAMKTVKVMEMSNHTVLISKTGKRIPVSDSAAPLKDKDGKVIGCVVVFRDVTKERQIDQMKSEFVSVASHQLRTPLTGIKWFVELLLGQKAGKLSKKQKDFLQQILISNERMIALVSDLLDVSHIETGKKFNIEKKEINPAEIFQQILTDNIALIQKKRIKIIRCRELIKGFKIFADADKIRQAFQNLLSNAVKYSRDGGRIELNCDRSNKNETIFSIKDSGFGIPENQQKRVFEKFFRGNNIVTKATDGTGLGLYITRAIVEAHGGKIWFESQENKGTAFHLSIPNK